MHRSVTHPRFGNFILLGKVLIDAERSIEWMIIRRHVRLTESLKLLLAFGSVSLRNPRTDSPAST